MEKEKGFSQILFLGILGVLTLGFIISMFLLPKTKSAVPLVHNQMQTTNQNGIPDMKVTDVSSNTPTSQKTAVVVQHSDSTFEKFLVPTSIVQNFISSLPKTDRVVSQAPLR